MLPEICPGAIRRGSFLAASSPTGQKSVTFADLALAHLGGGVGRGEVSMLLQDADYIQWAQTAKWSVEEAISLSQGERPDPKLSVEQLVERFSRTKAAVRYYDGLRRRAPKQVTDRLPVSPEDWIYWMFHNVASVAQGWEAIYPYAPLEASAVAKREEPDYRIFVDHYVRDLQLSLRQLVIYALKCRPDSCEQFADYRTVLMRTHATLPSKERATTASEMGDVLTSPSRFIESYPAGFPLDEICISWNAWVQKHHELVAWIQSQHGPQVNAPVPSATNTTASKYHTGLQSAINTIVPKLSKATIGGLKQYLRERGAESHLLPMRPLELDIPNCDEIYLDGQKLVWTDREGRECTRSLRSIERYLNRAVGKS